MDQPRSVLLGVLLAGSTSAFCSAQGALYSPRHLATKPGDSMTTYLLFSEPAFQVQIVDGENLGATASLKEIAFRQSSLRRGGGAGRTWTQMTVRIGDGDLSRFGKLSTANFLSTPSVVFQGSASWPTLPYVSKVPPPWGGSTGALRFPFKSPWKYSGRNSILSEFQATGGRLHNPPPWCSGWNCGYSKYQGYALDSILDPTGQRVVALDGSVRLPLWAPPVTYRCSDAVFAAYPVTWTTQVGFGAETTGSQGSPPNSLVLSWTTRFTAPAAPVLHVFGLGVSANGVNVGTGCYHLHAVGPTLLLTMLANKQEGLASARAGVPWHPSLGGFDIVFQGAWLDSRDKRLNLTPAALLRTPTYAPPSRPIRRKMALSANFGAVSDWGIPSVRYRY